MEKVFWRTKQMDASIDKLTVACKKKETPAVRSNGECIWAITLVAFQKKIDASTNHVKFAC